MIDITTIQTYPIPESISSLSNDNVTLKQENKQIKTIMKYVIVAVCAYAIYSLIQKQNEKNRKENQPNRN
jgi:hypothetical protein